MNRNVNGDFSYCSIFNPDTSETVAYNNPLFPAYVRYGILSKYPGYSSVSHWHADLEFIHIKKGGMTYNVNGELVELAENTGIIVNSRQIHHGFSTEHRECEFVCVLLSPELLQGNMWFYNNCIERVTENTSCPYLYLENEGWRAGILEKIDKIYGCCPGEHGNAQADNLPYFELVEIFCSIMKTLYSHIPDTGRATKKESAEIVSLKNMIAYIDEHFAEHIALDDLAAAGACCKSRCSQLFRKYLSDTPVSYVTKLRLRKSLAALLELDMCITDIALEYGFGGASYYCETFRKYYGMPPFKYKMILGSRGQCRPCLHESSH